VHPPYAFICWNRLPLSKISHAERGDGRQANRISFGRDAGKFAGMFGGEGEVNVHLVALGQHELDFDLHAAEDAAHACEELPHARGSGRQAGGKVMVHERASDHVRNAGEVAHDLIVVPLHQGLVRC
jgi:hypothetical protein